MLYEMLTRELPLGHFKLPHERGSAVPPLTDQILRKALAQEKENRHETAQQLECVGNDHTIQRSGSREGEHRVEFGHARNLPEPPDIAFSMA